MSTVSVALTPLESLCFEQVSFWVGVVARNNGKSGRVVAGTPWTRLPAKDVVSNLEERLPFLSVTVRQVRKALARLVELGLVVREQFSLPECLRSDYWYTLAAVPVASVATETPGTETVTPCDPAGTRDVPEQEPPSDQNGNPNLCTQPSSQSAQTRQTEDVVVEGQPPTSPVVPASLSGASAAASPEVVPPVSPVTPVNPLAGLQGSVWDRINALTARFDPRTVQPVSPRAVVVGNRTLHVSDGACAPLR